MALRGHNVMVAPIESTVRFLVTVCGPCILAFPADWVRGILTQEEAGHGQTVSSAGVTYPITGFAERLGIPPGVPSAETRLILCGNGICARALIVDRVVGLIDMDWAALRPLPAQFRGSERTKLSGYLLYEDAMVLVVNPAWLLEIDAARNTARSCTRPRPHETSELPRVHDPDARSVVEHVM
jgi:hypothetical protein